MYDLYNGNQTERGIPLEPEPAEGPEQGVQAGENELENLPEPLLDFIFIAFTAAGLLHHLPVLPDDLHPAGVQEEQYPDSAVAG